MPVNPLAIDVLTRQAQGFAPSMQPPAVAGMVPGGFGAPAQNVPTTTVPAPAPAGKQGAFDALVGQSVGNGMGNGTGPSASVAPTSINDIPQVNRDDFTKRPDKNWGDLRQLNSNLSQTISPSGPTDDQAAAYQQAKIDRLSQIAALAGMSPEQQAAVVEQVTYQVESSPTATDPTARMDAVDAAVGELEASLAAQAIQASTGAAAGAETASVGQWTPEQMMTAQTLAGNFLKPYADQMAANGQMQAAALNEMAKGMPPEMANLVRSQAATRAAGDARLSQAYMQQAMMIPAMAAYQQAGAMQGEIDNLTRQVMAQQSGGGAATLTPDALAGMYPPVS